MVNAVSRSNKACASTAVNPNSYLTVSIKKSAKYRIEIPLLMAFDAILAYLSRVTFLIFVVFFRSSLAEQQINDCRQCERTWTTPMLKMALHLEGLI